MPLRRSLAIVGLLASAAAQFPDAAPPLGISFSGGGLAGIASATCQLHALELITDGRIGLEGDPDPDAGILFSGLSAGAVAYMLATNAPRLSIPPLQPNYTVDALANWTAPPGGIPLSDGGTALSLTRLFGCALEVLSGGPGSACEAISPGFATCLHTEAFASCLVLLVAETFAFDAYSMSARHPFTLQFAVTNKAAWPFSRPTEGFDLEDPQGDDFRRNAAFVYFTGVGESAVATTSPDAVFTPDGYRRNNLGERAPLRWLDAVGNALNYFNSPHPFLQQPDGPDIVPPVTAGEVCRGQLDEGLPEAVAASVREVLNGQVVTFGEWQGGERRQLLFGSRPHDAAIATDGGMLESTGIVGLLVGGARVALNFANLESPLVSDAPHSLKTSIRVYGSLFGVVDEVTAAEVPCAYDPKHLLQPHLQVFDSALWPSFKAMLVADGVAVLENVEVLANPFFGVKPYTLNKLVVVSTAVPNEFAAYMTEWEAISASLLQDTQTDDRFIASFPYYAGILELPPIDMNALCLARQYTILEHHRALFIDLLNTDGTAPSSEA